MSWVGHVALKLKYSYKVLAANMRKKCFGGFYMHVTMHRNGFLFNNQPDALINQIYSVINLFGFGGLGVARWP